MKRKKTNKLAVRIALGSILIIVILLILFLVQSVKIPVNSTGTVGNTAGNLNNGGLFCEDSQGVYFSNSYDDGYLYSMNADGTNLKRVLEAPVTNVNVAGNYLYFYKSGSGAGSGLGYYGKSNGIYRIKKNGSGIANLDRVASGTTILIDNSVFYQHYDSEDGMTLYKVGIDGQDPIQMGAYIINPASYEAGYLYFNGTVEDHALYSMNVETGAVNKIWDYALWNPVVEDGYVYFMDIANNYRLCRYEFSSGEIQVLTEDRVDLFNVYENIIYYQKNSATDPALMRMYTDGTNQEVVASGNYSNVNITSQYVYFNEFDTTVPVYQTSTYGSVNVVEFSVAKEAAILARTP